jgi:hypothetical protein
VWGLFAWRWITTLAAFGLGWAAARRMGATGFAPLIAVVLGAMVYRGRSMCRPETLVAPLFALTLLALEWRRRGGRVRVAGRSLDPAWALVPIGWVWANAHISYWFLFLAAGAYGLDVLAGEGARTRATAPLGILVLASLAAVAAALANPFGWRTLAQPFEYAFFWRNEPIYQSIGELKPVDWSANLVNGLPILVVAWPLLALRRLAIGRRDLAELVLCAVLLTLTLTGQRFMGFLAVGAVPFLGRDLAQVAGGLRVRLARPWPRAAAALGVIALLASPILTDASQWIGVGFNLHAYPVGACDFIARQGIRGRLLNSVFFHGGYLLWRFWPERDRLPFMDIHQSGTREDRDAMATMGAMEEQWRGLDARRRFDVIVGARYREIDMPFLNRIDADSTWALVFADDAAAVYLRREPRFASLIASHGYRLLPGGEARLARLQPAAVRDTALRAALTREFERSVSESRASSRALYVLGTVAALESRLNAADSLFRRALAADPDARRAHEGLGAIAAVRGRPREAIAQYRVEARNFGWVSGLPMRMADAYRALGDRAAARHWYERELREDPGDAAARDSLAAMEGGAR